jgi:hypothetical protein
MTDARATLQPLVGEWSAAVVWPGEEHPAVLPDMGARTSWEWMGDSPLLIQRWSVPIPEAPDGLAVIGWDDARGTFLQHYFDDRGVIRVYELAFDGRELRLERTQADFSPLEFSQRFVGTFSEDGHRIDGAWYIAEDHVTWRKDFDLVYTRLAAT